MLFSQELPRRISGKQGRKKVLRNSHLPKALDTGRSILLWMLFLFDLGVIYQHKTKQKLTLADRRSDKTPFLFYPTNQFFKHACNFKIRLGLTPGGNVFFSPPLLQHAELFSKLPFCSTHFEQNQGDKFILPIKTTGCTQDGYLTCPSINSLIPNCKMRELLKPHLCI